MEMTPGRVLSEKLRLERPLASGGMGHVWLGRHLLLDVPVALKFMDASLDGSPEARARFEREAKAAAQLRSQHIVQILDYGVEDGAPFIVMEHLSGEDLRTRLDREKRLPIGEVAEIIAQVAKGLKLAHDAGIVHRDLKPGNVFLAKIGDDEIAKILDFGVAKASEVRGGETTTTGRLLGSPEYMSPEQARGGDLDPRSDLWSLAVVVFRALTGRRPFNATHVGDLLVKICSDPAPRATEIAPDLPKAIDDFFERGLCKSPDGRFTTARDFSEALTAIARGVEASATSASMGSGASASSSQHAAATASAIEARTTAPEIAERTQATVSIGVAASGAPAPAPDRSRARVWAIASAIAVLAIAATTARFFAGSSAPVAASASPSPERADAKAATSEPAIAPAPSPSSVVTSALTASAAPSSAPVATSSQPPVRRPPRTSSSAATVDPKFGLPVGK